MISKSTLFEYLSGRANPLERKSIEDWLKDNDNAETFYAWLLEWESQFPQYVPDQEVAVKNLLQRIDSGAENEETDSAVYEKENVRGLRSRRFLMAAASVLFIIGIGWRFQEPILYHSYSTAYGQTTDVYLEDGSRVALNSNSTLKVPRIGFWGDTRQVSLEGEAEFSISHTIDNKRFIVKTSDSFQVEVLGTRFSVFARPRGTSVALKSGSVRIDYQLNEVGHKVMMKPGDLATLDKTGEVRVGKQADPQNFALWKTGRYAFNATSIGDIATIVRENFGITIKADQEIMNRKITGNFHTENLDELLSTLSVLLDLKTQYISKDSIYLSNY